MSRQNDSEQPNRLPLKSIQATEESLAAVKNRPRPPPEEQDKIVKKKRNLLSFEDDMEVPIKHQKIEKAGSANLDKNRTELSKLNKANGKQNLQQELKSEFIAKVQKLNEELFEVDYSYWDGPSLVKKLKRKKKQTVKNLIEVCRLELIENFQSLATLDNTELLMVIKDFILPHKISISEVEALELKTGKGDLLLNFKSVKIKDINLSVNMDGPIRIIEKSKYQKNSASYPFSTWKTMDFD